MIIEVQCLPSPAGTPENPYAFIEGALKVIQDLLLPDNGVFIRIRRQGDTAQRIRVKAMPAGFADAHVILSPGGAKITGLYHCIKYR